MAFLGGIISTVLTHLLTALAAWAAAKFHSWYMDNQQKKSAEDKTANAVQAVKDAKTPQEIDDAAKNIASDL